VTPARGDRHSLFFAFGSKENRGLEGTQFPNRKGRKEQANRKQGVSQKQKTIRYDMGIKV